MQFVHEYRHQPNSARTFLLAAVLLAASMTGAVTITAFAQHPGDLDPTFGNGGKVITVLRGSQAWANSVAIQADGKIVAAGFDAHDHFGEPDYGYDFALARYNSNGSLDTSFGSGGKVITHLGTATFDLATSVAIQSDGKIVAAGYSGTHPGAHFTLVRYNANGSLDAAFGSGGIVISLEGVANSVAIQADGKIVAVGFILGYPNFALIRLNTDGSSDTSFGTGGIVITPGVSSPWSVAIQSDGKIVAAGNSRPDLDNADFALARYHTDGSLDVSFGSGGIVITPVGTQNDFAFSVAIQSDGKIVAAGRSRNSLSLNDEFALARYNSNGLLDTSFGSGGIVITQIGASSQALSVAIQSDGKIVAAGSSWFDSTFNDFALARYNPNGSLDATFGGDGISTIDFNNSYDDASGMAFDGQGRAVVVGRSDATAFAIARFLLEPNKDRYDFDGDGRSDVSVFRPSDSVWYIDRSTAGFTAAQFGLSTDKIVPADYDGDGKTDIAVYREGIWYWLNSSNGALNTVQFGSSEDMPTPADYDGDRHADVSVFRPSNGTWYRLNSSNGLFYAVQFGASEDKPTVGDFDGDGRSDVAVFRPSNGAWYRLNSSNGQFVAVGFGLGTDLVSPADFDGDSKTDVAVYRPSTGTWYSLNSSNGSLVATQFGTSEDIPTAADYDGDGKADVALFRPSNGVWYRLNSSNGSFFAVQFGRNGDQPTPAAFRF